MGPPWAWVRILFLSLDPLCKLAEPVFLPVKRSDDVYTGPWGVGPLGWCAIAVCLALNRCSLSASGSLTRTLPPGSPGAHVRLLTHAPNPCYRYGGGMPPQGCQCQASPRPTAGTASPGGTRSRLAFFPAPYSANGHRGHPLLRTTACVWQWKRLAWKPGDQVLLPGGSGQVSSVPWASVSSSS